MAAESSTRAQGKRRTSEGDVFAVPMEPDLFGFGQVVARQHPIWYMIAFDCFKGSGSIAVHEIVTQPILLLGNFFDVLLTSGRWPVLGNQPPGPGIPYPCYSVVVDGIAHVESWDAKQRRPASAEDLSKLENRTNRGPIILESALRAHAGGSPLEPSFEPLTLAWVQRSSKLLDR